MGMAKNQNFVAMINQSTGKIDQGWRFQNADFAKFINNLIASKMSHAKKSFFLIVSDKFQTTDFWKKCWQWTDAKTPSKFWNSRWLCSCALAISSLESFSYTQKKTRENKHSSNRPWGLAVLLSHCTMRTPHARHRKDFVFIIKRLVRGVAQGVPDHVGFPQSHRWAVVQSPRPALIRVEFWRIHKPVDPQQVATEECLELLRNWNFYDKIDLANEILFFWWQNLRNLQNCRKSNFRVCNYFKNWKNRN